MAASGRAGLGRAGRLLSTSSARSGRWASCFSRELRRAALGWEMGVSSTFVSSTAGLVFSSAMLSLALGSQLMCSCSSVIEQLEGGAGSKTKRNGDGGQRPPCFVAPEEALYRVWPLSELPPSSPPRRWSDIRGGLPRISRDRQSIQQAERGPPNNGRCRSESWGPLAVLGSRAPDLRTYVVQCRRPTVKRGQLHDVVGLI